MTPRTVGCRRPPVAPARPALAALLAIALATAGSAPAQSVGFTPFQVAGDAAVDAAIRVDIDADGAADLAVAVRGATQYLDVYYADGRTRRLPLRRDITAFAFADLLPSPGREVVLIGPSVVVAGRLPADGEVTYVRVLDQPVLWQSPAPDRVLAWQDGVRVGAAGGEVGRDALFVPGLDGYHRIAPAPDGGIVTQYLLLPAPLPDGPLPGRVEFRLAFGRSNGDRTDVLLEAEHRVPSPAWVDFDGDGDVDLCALGDKELWVWLDGDAWRAPGELLPDLRLGVDVLERPVADPTFRVQLADLDGDGRADLVWTRSTTAGGEPSTAVTVHLQRDGFAERHDRLRFAGLGVVTQLEDLDGDARPELLVGALQTDVMALAGGGDLQVVVSVADNGFTDARPRFRRPLAMNHTLALPASVLRPGGSRSSMLLRGPDGQWALLLREQTERLSLRPLRRSGRALELGAPSWQGRIHADAEVAAAGDRAFLVVEPRQVLVGEVR